MRFRKRRPSLGDLFPDHWNKTYRLQYPSVQLQIIPEYRDETEYTCALLILSRRYSDFLAKFVPEVESLRLRLPKIDKNWKPRYDGSVIAGVQLAIVFDAEVSNVSEKYEVAIEDFKSKSRVIPLGFDHSSECRTSQFLHQLNGNLATSATVYDALTLKGNVNLNFYVGHHIYKLIFFAADADIKEDQFIADVEALNGDKAISSWKNMNAEECKRAYLAALSIVRAQPVG